MPPCLTLSIKVLIKGKWSNSEKGVAPSPTPWCSTYWKRRFHVILDNGHQLYFYYIKYQILLHTQFVTKVSFQPSLACLTSVDCFSLTGYHTKVKEPSLLSWLFKAEEGIVGFMPVYVPYKQPGPRFELSPPSSFPMTITPCEAPITHTSLIAWILIQHLLHNIQSG